MKPKDLLTFSNEDIHIISFDVKDDYFCRIIAKWGAMCYFFDLRKSDTPKGYKLVRMGHEYRTDVKGQLMHCPFCTPHMIQESCHSLRPFHDVLIERLLQHPSIRLQWLYDGF